MTMGATQVTIVYDGDGNRVAKTVGGVTTRYLVEDVNPTRIRAGRRGSSWRVLCSARTPMASSASVRISSSDGGWTQSFYGYDGFGSVRQLTDSAGAVTDTYKYDAWGNSFGSTGSTPNVYLYRGEQYDSDLMLYYLRARYFNPLAGRFLTRDPAQGSRWIPSRCIGTFTQVLTQGTRMIQLVEIFSDG